MANTYDAIAIGSGVSGGWTPKELSEKGLKTGQIFIGAIHESSTPHRVELSIPDWHFLSYI